MRTLPLLAVLGAATLAGCPRAGVPLGELPRPGLALEDVGVSELGFEQVELTFGFRIDNPYPVSLRMQPVSWTLELAGAQILQGEGPGATLPGRTDARLDMPVTLRWTDILPALRAMGGADELPWTLHGHATFNTPLGPVDVPFRQSGQLPLLHPPQVSLRELRLNALDLRQHSAVVDIVLDVGSPQRIRVDSLDYALWLDGATVATGTATIDRYDPDGLIVATQLPLLELGDASLDALATRGVIRARLEGTAHVQTAHGLIPLVVTIDDLIEIHDRSAL